MGEEKDFKPWTVDMEALKQISKEIREIEARENLKRLQYGELPHREPAA